MWEARTSHSFILLSKYSVIAYEELETDNTEAKSDSGNNVRMKTSW